MTLPPALAPLAEVVAPDTALLRLVVPMSGNASPGTISLIEELDLSPALLTLALLYVDELERAHDICQAMTDATGSALHAIVHRREGDFSNALYWWHRAGDHPALLGLDPRGLVRAVESGDRSETVVERQRAEWAALAAWCAA